MSDRHLHDLDRATALAARALAARPDTSAESLTRLLRSRWWLGAGLPTDVVIAQRRLTDPRRTSTPGARPSVRSLTPTEPWRVWGEQWDPSVHPHERLLRVYLAGAPGTGLQTVATITDHARRWSVPWLLSSRAMHERAPRPDATVLSVPASALPCVRAPLARLVGDLRPLLASRAPLLTLHVVRGVGIAESPEGGSGFGTHRCRLVAEAVLEHRDEPPALLQKHVHAAFWAAGIDPRRPYRSVEAAWQWHGERVAA